jgi:hypothetical protein
VKRFARRDHPVPEPDERPASSMVIKRMLAIRQEGPEGWRQVCVESSFERSTRDSLS